MKGSESFRLNTYRLCIIAACKAPRLPSITIAQYGILIYAPLLFGLSGGPTLKMPRQGDLIGTSIKQQKQKISYCTFHPNRLFGKESIFNH